MLWIACGLFNANDVVVRVLAGSTGLKAEILLSTGIGRGWRKLFENGNELWYSFVNNSFLDGLFCWRNVRWSLFKFEWLSNENDEGKGLKSSLSFVATVLKRFTGSNSDWANGDRVSK